MEFDAELVTFASGIVAIAGAAGVVYFATRWIVTWARALSLAVARVDEEFHPNEGRTMRDALDRHERDGKRQMGELRDLITAQDASQSASIRAVHGRIDEVLLHLADR